MPARLVALDEGPDIPLDRAMVVVGRHPQCDARLDSLRVSRHHCCMTQDHGELIVRDLGSTNGIRINGQRVEFGRLRAGDELSIAHIRYRLDNGQGHEATLADPQAESRQFPRSVEPAGQELNPPSPPPEAVLAGAGAGAGVALGVVAASRGTRSDSPLAAAVRGLLPSNLAERCRIEVIVKMDDDDGCGPVAVDGPAAPE